MKLRTIAACMLAFGVCPFVRAQYFPDESSERAKAERYRDWCRSDLERARRILMALQSPEEFLGTPLGNSELDEKTTPKYMRERAEWSEMTYDPQWDKSPIHFYTARVRFIDQLCQKYARKAEQLSPQSSARQSAGQVDGPLDIYRDSQNRPIVTDDLIRRYIKAEYSKTQTGGGHWRAGNFTKFDYDDVVKRIEWARSVKRSQGGERLVSTPAMREQFSDGEVHALNSRWRDLENAQNGRWDEVNW